LLTLQEQRRFSFSFQLVCLERGGSPTMLASLRAPLATLTAATALATALVAPPVATAAEGDGRIVYVAGTGHGTNTTYDIHVVDADGTGDVNLTPDPTPETPDEWQDIEPAWSPDGTRIAFVSNRVTESKPDPDYEIFVMDADGSDVTQVTFAQAPDPWTTYSSSNPTWSPDGTQLAFSGYRQFSTSEIFVVPADGSGTERRVTNPADFADKWEPDWSPDGSKILFVAGFGEFGQDLRTIAPDGSGETDLTPGTEETSERNGVWSPDGSRIAFRTNRDGGIYPNPNAEIYVMEYPSGVLSRVTDHPAIDESPAWSPDGTEIAFTSLRANNYDLYVTAAPPLPTAIPTARVATAGTSTMRTASASEPVLTLSSEGSVRPLVTGAGGEQDPHWGGTATAGPDLTPPSSTITSPRDDAVYRHKQLKTLTGTATDGDSGVQAVEVAVRRNRAKGDCQWWTGSAWTAGSCNQPVWLAARGMEKWSYTLPTLPKTHHTSTVGYTVFARATDAAGNVESAAVAGQNQATFRIS
jgi:Tol biopolymer transport system component